MITVPLLNALYCERIADLTGLEWNHNVLHRSRETGHSKLDRIDPFFEWLGEWDAASMTYTEFPTRCTRCAEHFHCSHDAVSRVVAAHFCAHAVLELGRHPVTGHTYIGVGDPDHTFKAKGYPWTVTHHHYDMLIPMEECFAQIFTYLVLNEDNDAEELQLFNNLSQGHAGIYLLSPNTLVPASMRRNWKAEIDDDPTAAAHRAARTLAHFTGGVPVTKAEIVHDVLE